MGDGVQLALCVTRQVRALGQVLAQQPINVFVGATLPQAVRIGKEHPDREPRCQALVLSHHFPPIVGQGFAQRSRHMPEFLRETLAGTPRIRPLHPCQEDQERRPLHPGADGRAIASPLDQVAPPSGRAPCGSRLRQGVRSSALYGGSGPVGLLPALEIGVPCAPQGTAWQHIQAHIDGLRRQLFPHIVRIRAFEPPGNLLGRTAVGQLSSHVLPQPGVEQFAWPPWLTSPDGRQRLCRAGTIGRAHRVAGVLAAHGARRSPQHPRNRPQRMAKGQTHTQGFTFFGTHVSIGSCLHGNTVAHPGVKCCTWS
jgi:hypothetical protein